MVKPKSISNEIWNTFNQTEKHIFLKFNSLALDEIKEVKNYETCTDEILASNIAILIVFELQKAVRNNKEVISVVKKNKSCSTS